MANVIKHIKHMNSSNFFDEEIILEYERYSKRIEKSTNSKQEAIQYLSDIINQTYGKQFHLFSFSYNHVEVIGVNLQFEPGLPILLKRREVNNYIDHYDCTTRYRVKGYHNFIDFSVEWEFNPASTDLLIDLDFKHPSIEDYKLYFTDKPDTSNIIECDNASIELKRYQFYNLAIKILSFFVHHLRSVSRIRIYDILIHFIDTKLYTMYDALLDLVSRLSGKSVYDLDIEFRNVNYTYNRIKPKISSVQLISRLRNSDEKFNYLINYRCDLSTEKVTSKMINFREVDTQKSIDFLLTRRDSFYSIIDEVFDDMAMVFYDNNNHKVFGLRYDSHNGVMTDQNGTRVGLNKNKIDILRYLYSL